MYGVSLGCSRDPMMSGQLLGRMGCAGNGCEMGNSDFYGKCSKICPDFYGKLSKFERRNIKKAPGRWASVLFCGDVALRSSGGLAFQYLEGGAGGGAEHVDAGCKSVERFCGLDAGAERDAVD